MVFLFSIIRGKKIKELTGVSSVIEHILFSLCRREKNKKFKKESLSKDSLTEALFLKIRIGKREGRGLKGVGGGREV